VAGTRRHSAKMAESIFFIKVSLVLIETKIKARFYMGK
jgi:hypothetical protein